MGGQCDAGNMGINNWKTAAQDREIWRRLLAEAKTDKGCSGTDDDLFAVYLTTLSR
jgi:hypothetical protein